MKKYKLIIENPTNAYILDKEKNLIIALCNTKRPDLKFDKLKDLIRKANENNSKDMFKENKEANEKLIEYIAKNLNERNDKYKYICDRLDFTRDDISFILEKIEEFNSNKS